MPATWLDDATLACFSPASTPASPFAEQTVEVTLNGQLHARTSSGVSFAYYDAGDVRISRLYPQGGPFAGGTTVTVWGSNLRDLDHGSGLKCTFGGPLVPATLVQGSSERLTCVTPRRDAASLVHTWDDSSQQCAGPARVRLTLNGNNSLSGLALTDDNVWFTFYE